MATKTYTSFTFTDARTETARTYYDLADTATETKEHKHMLHASAYTEGQYTDSAKYVHLIVNGSPDLSNPDKFHFYEEDCQITAFGDKSSSSFRQTAAKLNYDPASHVRQLYGKLDTKQGVDRYIAFGVVESTGQGSRSIKRYHYIGSFGSESDSYNEQTRTFAFDYIGVENSPATYDRMVAFGVRFAGYETWTKSYNDTYTHYLATGGSNPLVYLGKEIELRDLHDLKWKYDLSRSQPKRNGYDWPDEGPTSTGFITMRNVQVSDLEKTKPDDPSFKVKVKTGYVDGDGDSVLLTCDTTVIGLSQTPFSKFVPAVTAYAVGDTISLTNIINNVRNWDNAVLAYSDGKTIHLRDVDLASGQSITATMSVVIGGVTRTDLRSLTIENLVSYGACSITLTFPTKYFGTLTHTYSVDITSALAYACRLENVKTDFVYGETASYGSSATAKLFDNVGTQIDSDTVANYLTAGTLVSDQKIANSSPMNFTTDVYLNGEAGQAIIKTTLQNANYYEYLAFVSFCDSFEISETNLGDVYVHSNVETSISSLLSGITGRYSYHHNTANGSTVETVNVANNALTRSTSAITATTDISNFQVKFSCTPSESPNQTLTASASLNVKINRFVGLQITHSATPTYYAGRQNTFAIPSDLVVKKVYNNPSLDPVELTEEEMLELEFRLSEGTSASELVATSSTFPSSTKTIYVTLTLEDDTVLQGSYSIAGDYQPDTVTAIKFGNSFSFTLGNKLSTYKNSGAMKMIAHYASGYTSNLTDEVFDDYTIVQKNGSDYLDYEKVIMVSGETFYVKHNGNYFTVGYETGVSITYVVPTGSISISGYQQTYINTVDKIDFRNVKAEITYANTNSATTVVAELDSGNVASSTTYALALTGIANFDGTEAFNITDEGLKFTKTITISAVNRFDANVSITATFTVEVIAISGLSITRLSIRNPKTEYNVGEQFLNPSDETLLDIYYSGSATPITVYLKDVPSIVATDPSQGTEFTRTNDSMVVTVRLLSDTTKYTTYTAKVVAIASSSITLTHNIVAVLIPNGYTTGISDLDDNTHYYHNANGNVIASGWYVLVDANLTEIDSDGARILKTGVNLTSQKIYGYIEDAFNTSLAARVILFDDYVPPAQGESNIEVKYPCFVSGNADKINKCHIAKLFGNSNAKNRLFVAGNPDFKNCDWHSGAVNTYLQQGETQDANGDFTYFGDMDYCFYGQTDNAIMGYDHVATDKMVVLKSKSRVEPTNYFRTSTLIQALDAGGKAFSSVDGSTLYQESFPLATGNVGEGMININAIANLNGDTLYISADNTVCGLNITGQVGDSQRISYSRSRFIDPELKQLDLSDAVLWTDNKSLFLFAGEATYMTNYETFDSETGQYEWWKINVKDVRCAIDIDGVTYFGSEDGSLYKFDKSIFYDCDKVFIEAGGALYITLSTLFSDNKIVYAQDVNDEIEEGAEYTFSMKPASLQKTLFRKVASIAYGESADVDLTIDFASNALKIVALDSNGYYDAERAQVLAEELAYEGKFYLNYADGKSAIDAIVGSQLADYYRAYTLVPTDEANDTYKMIDANGNEVELSRLVTYEGQTSRVAVLNSANLCRALDEEYEVYALDKENCCFKLRHNGREVDVIRYGDQNLAAASFVSELHKHTPVYSYFIAAPAVLGDLSHRKTIWAWTLSSFKEPNDLQVCQATNEQNLEDMKALAFADNVPIGYNLKKFGFATIDFEKSAVPRKFTYIRPISVPFVAFGFKSEKAVNSILTVTSIVYTIPMMGRGNK